MKTALITGGSRGIGAALCRQLVEAGVRVYSCSRSADAPMGGVTMIECDVSDEADVAAMCAQIASLESGLDLLVNNAGILGPRTTLENVTIAQWRTAFAVNADGPFLVTKGCLPLLRASRGVVVNVSSSVGRKGRGEWGPYACSKHALEGMTDVFADELRGDGIAVMSVNPGGTATDMRAEAFPDEDPDTLPAADEVAAVILMLARQPQTGAKHDVRDHL